MRLKSIKVKLRKGVKMKIKSILGMIFIWLIYCAFYYLLSHYFPQKLYFHWFQGIIETLLYIIAFAFSLILFKLKKFTAIIGLFSVSFFIGLIQTVIYNSYPFVLENASVSSQEFLAFQLPFILLLISQTLAWIAVLYSRPRVKRDFLVCIPVAALAALILFTFIIASSLFSQEYRPLIWAYQTSAISIELISFMVLTLCLCASNSPGLSLSAIGYLIIIATDFIMRVYLIAKQPVPYWQVYESFWVLGQWFWVVGFFKLRDEFKKKAESKFELTVRWNSIQFRLCLWSFVISTYSMSLILILIFILYYQFILDHLALLQSLPCLIIFFSITSILISLLISKKISQPFSYISNFSRKFVLDQFYDISQEKIIEKSHIYEISELEDCVLKAFQIAKEQLLIQKKLSEIGQLAVQVAHDIRSPLAVLDTVVTSLQDKIPEQERIMMRTAFRRINNIANDLVAKYKGRDHSPDTLVFVYVAIKDIVSEKDLEYGHRHISFELILDNPESAFLLTLGNYKEIRRMLSNLINNAVNAMPAGGTIQIFCESKEKNIIVRISDQGIGIEQERITRLLSEESKEGRIGLGLSHAKDYMKKYKGKIDIKSQLEVGTTLYLIFEIFPKPKWLADKLKINIRKTTIILDDDDASIHDIWTKKFEKLNLERKDFYNTKDAKIWLKNDGMPSLILCDYEFLGQKESGLDFLEGVKDLNCLKYLVTTHVDDEKILYRCESLGLQLIPKHLLPYVCVEVTNEQSDLKLEDLKQKSAEYDAVFIDDEAYNHEFWQFVAERKKISLLCLFSLDEFETIAQNIPIDTPIYIDLNLEKLSGLEVANILKTKGFTRLYIATRFVDFNEADYAWLAGVIGNKEPPF